MQEIDTAIIKLTDHISKQEAKQEKKLVAFRIEYLNGLARAKNDLLKFKEEHRRVLGCILL